MDQSRPSSRTFGNKMACLKRDGIQNDFLMTSFLYEINTFSGKFKWIQDTGLPRYYIVNFKQMR